MRIPHAENVTVDILKLRDYCLSPAHPEGQHKARLFVAALGMTDAEPLRDALLQVVNSHDATLGRRDAYGQRYQMREIRQNQNFGARIYTGINWNTRTLKKPLPDDNGQIAR